MTDAELVAFVEQRCAWDGDCLLWPGAMSGGVGAPVTTDKQRLSVNIRRRYFVALGRKLTDSLLVVPTCRNPRCLSHLAAMTRSELNLLSATHGGRSTTAVRVAMRRAGRSRSSSVGSMEVARRIRALRAEGLTYEAISAATGVPPSRCFDVCAGRAWVETLPGASVFTGLGIV